MLESLRRLARRMLQQPSGPTAAIRTVAFFSPAEFEWEGPSGPLRFTIAAEAMRRTGPRREMELSIIGHGVKIIAVLDGTPDAMLIYLGNYFMVPEHLKRLGLATSCLATLREVFQVVSFGAALADQPTSLEGFFVGEGVHYAKGVCAGHQPMKGAPAQMNLDRLVAARRRVTVVRSLTPKCVAT